MERVVKILFVVLVLVSTGCRRTVSSEYESEKDTTYYPVQVVEPDTAVVEIDTMTSSTPIASEQEKNEKPVVEPKKQNQAKTSVESNNSSRYYEEEDDENESSSSSSYWDEVRKSSPNDNYLLGFDEDVDDVHDVEIYMEDY